MRRLSAALLALSLSIIYPRSAFSYQEQPETMEVLPARPLPIIAIYPFELQSPSAIKSKPPNPDEHRTYLKADFGYGMLSIIGFDYSFKYIGVNLQTHFPKTHFGFISGYSWGYRKEEIQNSEQGHYLNVRVFQRVGGGRAYAKVSEGVEWGMPGDVFTRTNFQYKNGSLIKYTHIYLDRNFWIPGVKVKRSGVLYPVFEIGGGIRTKHFNLESGLRGGFFRFGVERYDLVNNDYGIDKIRVIVPSVFVSIGFGG